MTEQQAQKPFFNTLHFILPIIKHLVHTLLALFDHICLMKQIEVKVAQLLSSAEPLSFT